jgi:kynurenine 3-monooxygenase
VSERIAIIGAGPVGSLLAALLGRRGCEVDLYERRPDMRRTDIGGGRSINLALSTRGIHALASLGIDAEILAHAVPMYGRTMHALDGTLTSQRYGVTDQHYINSISRGELNKTLMTAAERTGHVSIHFEQRVDSVTFRDGGVRINDALNIPRVIGTDGSASILREAITKQTNGTTRSDELDYGYKELTIPAGPGGTFALEKHALHIWPRGTFMLIALPNFDGSFTCTLFLPFTGLQQLRTPTAVNDFFKRNFADAAPLIPDLAESFFANPTGHMFTVRQRPWHVDERALILGDAAHSIVPFFGQGLNAGFEDCALFDAQLARGDSWVHIFAHFSDERVHDTDAIAQMAIENFEEMRDKVGNARFLLEKAVERRLQSTWPDAYLSRYSLVTFSRVPYRVAEAAGRVQDALLKELCANISDASEVDMTRAQTLVRERLTPLYGKV